MKLYVTLYLNRYEQEEEIVVESEGTLFYFTSIEEALRTLHCRYISLYPNHTPHHFLRLFYTNLYIVR